SDWVRGGGGSLCVWQRAIPGEFNGGWYAFRAWVEDKGGYTEGEATVLDWERLRPPVRVRTWAAGDRFQPAGASEAKPVKEFFERARIPSWDRGQWPMITDSDGIVWIYRFGTAARAAAGSSTRVRLQVRCDTVSSK
ncbi:MAG: tRNA lysidine(34) synthetase TilS, partial [Bryobacterales bacterium]|nr:tRNA lysidine(34) synthetase TilS [Bryobacterales bacterium]